MFKLLTDTSANLPAKELRDNEIGVIPFSFIINGETAACEAGDDFDGKAFFDGLRGGMRAQTSQITPIRYIEYFEPILKGGDDVLYVGMSSGVSGSFSSAEMASVELRERYPDRKLCLVDTLGASLGEGLMVLKAAEYRDSGATIEETAEAVRGLCRRMCQVFTVDDLSYLKRSGRLSNIGAAIGTVLNIKPILKGDLHGKIVSFAKLRGRRHAVEFLAKQYDALVKNAGEQTVGIAHADCPEDAALLQELLNRNNPPKQIMTVCYEPVTGSHVGPGTLALFFLGDEEFRKTPNLF